MRKKVVMDISIHNTQGSDPAISSPLKYPIEILRLKPPSQGTRTIHR